MLEMSLRQEARDKGMSEDQINKYIPMGAPRASNPDFNVDDQQVLLLANRTYHNKSTIVESVSSARVGDPVSFTMQLDKLKEDRLLYLWNSSRVLRQGGYASSFSTSATQLTVQTGIEPAKLKLDTAGYNFTNILLYALALASVLGISGTLLGGQVGFLLSYASALAPVLLVSIGSAAPGLLNDLVFYVQCQRNREVRERFVHMNAGKFLVGYVLGLPVARFASRGGISSTVEFFQKRPDSTTVLSNAGRTAVKTKSTISQMDIALASVLCVAGSVAEVTFCGEGSGTNTNDVLTLYGLLRAVDEPRPLSEEAKQEHICWSALRAHEILQQHDIKYKALVQAFRECKSLPDCIAIMECSDF